MIHKSDKILFLTTEFPPQPGGIGNHAFNLSLELQKEGKDIIVVTDIRSENGIVEKEFDSSLPFIVKRVKREKLIFVSYFNRFFIATKQIKNVDTVMASGKFSLWLVFFLKFFFKRKYVAIIHGSEVLLPNKSQRKFTDSCLKKFDTVIAVSNYTKSLVSQLKLNNCVVIPNGFSPSQLEIENISNDLRKLNLVTVGNVTRRKGQQNVIKAIPDLLKKYPNLEYHIVGIPTEKQKLERLAAGLNILNHIIFHGKVSEEKKWELLNKSAIFMMLSEETISGDVEGFGIAILEANSIGLPAIGSENCGIEDAINQHRSGVLVDPKNSNEIVRAIDEIANSYQEFSGNSVDWSDKFTWDKIVKQYIKAIDK